MRFWLCLRSRPRLGAAMASPSNVLAPSVTGARSPRDWGYVYERRGSDRAAIANAITHPTNVQPAKKLMTTTEPTFGTLCTLAIVGVK
ncbi:MAG TPA: hypothetical protein VGU02_00080 [Gaiellaceae bacterium]|nr:hypothetical protein [Gaiellaceae bacterium]